MSSAAFTGAAEPVVSPVHQFVAELHGFERQLRGAFAAGGRLQVAAVEAQAAEGLSPVAGHQVLAAITAAQTAISEALTQAAGGHRLIERLGRSMAYDVQAYGEGTKPPEQVFSPLGARLDPRLDPHLDEVR